MESLVMSCRALNLAWGRRFSMFDGLECVILADNMGYISIGEFAGKNGISERDQALTLADFANPFSNLRSIYTRFHIQLHDGVMLSSFEMEYITSVKKA